MRNTYRNSKVDTSKHVFFLGSLLLVCLIFPLNSIDSPGYIHCHRTDVLEFFGISRELSETRKPRIIIEVINKRAKRVPPIRELLLFISSHILSKYINPYKHHKMICSPFEKGSKILIDQQENISPSTGNCLSFQALRIITTSIIRS